MKVGMTEKKVTLCFPVIFKNYELIPWWKNPAFKLYFQKTYELFEKNL
jgi:hypothetical protein